MFICENHGRISLVSTAFKLLGGINPHRLSISCKNYTRENQASFRPGINCPDQVFNLGKFKNIDTFCRRMVSVFLQTDSGQLDWTSVTKDVKVSSPRSIDHSGDRGPM